MPPTASPRKPDTSPDKSQSVGASPKKKAVKKDGPPAAGGRDIRNFFAQGGAASGPSKKPGAASNGAGSGKQPISIDDSDEEVESVEAKPSVKSEPKMPASKTSKHFSKPSSSKQPISIIDTPSPPPSKSTAKAKTPSSTGKGKAAPKRKSIQSSEDEEDEEDVKPAKKRQSLGGGRAKKVNYLESSEEEEEEEEVVEEKKPVVAKGKAKGKSSAAAKKEDSPMDVDDDSEDDDFDEEDEDEDDDVPKKKKKPASKAKPPPPATKKTTPAKKPPPKKEVAASAKKPTPKKPAAKVEKEDDDGDVEEEKPKPKNNYFAMKAARAAGPKAAGSKEIPEGAPGCLEGLTFVFTGELESLGREDAQELAKRYSGRVTSGPSKKTSFVVVGENAGASKLTKIKELNIKTLNEDEFLDLIRTRGGGELDEKALKAKEKEEQKIAAAARDMEKREKEEEQLRKRKEKAMDASGIATKKTVPISAQLWTTRYAPQNVKEICGNKAPVERLGQWLQDWDKSYKAGFKKPGKDGMNIYRAVLISGPPGIGKTTAAHLMAKQAGYNPLELNASDARSKKLVENYTNIDNASLDGFFQGTGLKSTTVIGDIRVDSRTCLIMDEVDGMSGGDRGGVGAMNSLIKKTRIPIILICNDRTHQKMKPFQSTTFNMTFRRPGPNEVRSRLMSILFKEKMKIPANVLDELVKGANSDIRQVLNMLSTFKLAKSDMDFDESKELLKINEKNTILTPFSIIDRLSGPYAWSRTSKETLNDRMELYFHDFSFVPLFMQEHYIKTNPAVLGQAEGPERNLKHLELVAKAADSISDGDLIDRMIHGSEQHWSLLPFHAVQSTVRPAFHIYGGMRQTGGPQGWGPSFPQWLGQNSKQNKLQRQLTDIQIRMRLRVSGSRQEIREQYMPMLAERLVLPLVQHGQDAVEETIGYMDEYYLGREDWDALVELGVDSMKEETVLKKIPTAVKTAFTRQYNKADHPIAFHKGDMFAASKKKIADIGPAPDNEEVFEEDEAPPDDVSEKADDAEDEVNDLSKDKLIKAVKPKGAKGKEAAAAKGKKK